MSTRKAAKGKKGKRYTPEEKQKVVEFVTQANQEKGRGGVAAAVKKFGISALTISAWIKGGAAGAEGAAKPGRKGNSEVGSSARAKLLGQLATLDKDIATRRKELNVLEAKFQRLKEQL